MKILNYLVIIFICINPSVKADSKKTLIDELQKGGKLIFIRGGLPSFYKQDKIEGPSFGIGMNYLINRTSTLLTIDYSLSDYGPLGEVKRLNIGFNF